MTDLQLDVSGIMSHHSDRSANSAIVMLKSYSRLVLCGLL